MVKKIAILVMVMSVSSPLICMNSLARLAARAAKATRLASRCKELAAKRTFIYSVRDTHHCENRDGSFDKIDVEARMNLERANLFARRAVLSRHVLPQIPVPEDKKKYYIYVAKLKYHGWFRRYNEPKYFYFENDRDIADIVHGAKTGKIRCAGEAILDDTITYGIRLERDDEYELDAAGKWIKTGKHAVKSVTLKVNNREPRTIEFYAYRPYFSK